CRLMRFDPEERRLANRRYTGETEAPYKFADAFPLLVTNTASLADLNSRLHAQGHPEVTMARFRANLVLDGLPAFEEDYVATLRIGALTLRVVKPCARCTVPGVDPITGAQSTTVPDVLATFRQTDEGVMFGVNAIVVAGAGETVRIGDTVDVALNL
ncbi:MAG TPA: MOSC domain-containing protein, partial [Burkholderiaceae bacterium]|nr:MOSC domain-containing protein [Burkholderiaceae bacterium]